MVSAQVRLALQAMRYYRLWIYASNLVLMAGVAIFASVAAALLSDPRRTLLSSWAVNLHQPSMIYAYMALLVQGLVLPVIGTSPLTGPAFAPSAFEPRQTPPFHRSIFFCCC